MSLESPIFKKVMSSYPQDDTNITVNPIDNRSSLAALNSKAVNLSPVDKGSSLAQPSMGSGPFPDDTPSPTNSKVFNFMDKLWDVETKGGTMSDRPGSQYKGIGQLGDAVRKPLLKKYGYTEEQYANDVDIQKEISTAHINNLQKQLGDTATGLDLWGAHNMGASGWRQIKSGKVSPQVLSNLRNQKGMNSKSTAQDYINYYSKIFQ